MAITTHWYLPTTGDARSILGSLRVMGRHDRRPDDEPGARPPSIDYLAQIARAAEDMGFDAALTPTGTWCDDAWITTAALTAMTTKLRYLVALRPGLASPTLVAQQAATYQRISGGRLLLNTVIGGDDPEQQRFGDYLGKDERYVRGEEWLEAFRGAWTGEPFSMDGEYVKVTGAFVVNPPAFPEIYLGGASPAALRCAARQADVFLHWGEPPEAIARQIDSVKELSAQIREQPDPLRFGIRLQVIARPTADEAWAAAECWLDGADDDVVDGMQAALGSAVSEGQKRQLALHGGSRDNLVVSPNLWAGPGLLRPGSGTALVGSYEDIADRLAEYHDLGVTEFILSGYPHLEEAYWVGEGVHPVLRERGLLAEPGSLHAVA
ncbi:Alkanesulfonate monooxygenase [Paraconexibacter sp. AEG42_29]|uniref:Alkanesulfonate monooxygenase n=1 Tax=Paraconexibacter sp. AEG42_29 TaxID=2997339 RepID=A0AAU7ARJ7_9ACTN